MVGKIYQDRNRTVDDLSKICGHSNVAQDAAEMSAFGFSAVAKPKVVVRPGSVEEIQQIILYAIRSNTGVIPFGGGTQIRQVMTGSPAGIGLCMDRLQRVHEIEPGNLSITTEAGVLNSTIQELLHPENLEFPVFADFAKSTIGGEVAANYSSWKRYKNGTARDYVLGLTFISPTGKVVKTGGKTVKNVSGYDLTKLLSGSWGTMGVLYLVTLKLNPLPEKKLILIREFTAVEGALEEGVRIQSKKPHLSSCNVFSGVAADAANSPITMSICLEGSGEFIDDQAKKLHLSSSWRLVEDKSAFMSAEASYLNMRRMLKQESFNTVVVDKRGIRAAKNILQFLAEKGCAFDFDITAGVLEFSHPGHANPSFQSFLGEWMRSLKGLNSNAKSFLPIKGPQPLLHRLLTTIDPHRIMFRNNLLTGGYHRE